jgi:hypothetical protein
MEADCDTDRFYLVVRKVRERLSVSKQAAKNFDVEKYNFWRDLTVRLITVFWLGKLGRDCQ